MKKKTNLLKKKPSKWNVFNPAFLTRVADTNDDYQDQKDQMILEINAFLKSHYGDDVGIIDGEFARDLRAFMTDHGQ